MVHGPAVHRAQGIGVDGIVAVRALDPLADHPGLAQDLEVAGNRGGGNRGLRRERSGGEFTPAEELFHQVQPGVVSQGGKGAGQLCHGHRLTRFYI